MYTLRLACSHVSACEAYNVNDATALNWRHLAPPVHVLACEALWMRREFAEQLCRDACPCLCECWNAGNSRQQQGAPAPGERSRETVTSLLRYFATDRSLFISFALLWDLACIAASAQSQRLKPCMRHARRNHAAERSAHNIARRAAVSVPQRSRVAALRWKSGMLLFLSPACVLLSRGASRLGLSS